MCTRIIWYIHSIIPASQSLFIVYRENIVVLLRRCRSIAGVLILPRNKIAKTHTKYIQNQIQQTITTQQIMREVRWDRCLTREPSARARDDSIDTDTGTHALDHSHQHLAVCCVVQSRKTVYIIFANCLFNFKHLVLVSLGQGWRAYSNQIYEHWVAHIRRWTFRVSIVSWEPKLSSLMDTG